MISVIEKTVCDIFPSLSGFGATYKKDKRDYGTESMSSIPDDLDTIITPIKSLYAEQQGFKSACTAFASAYNVEKWVNMWGRDNGYGYIDIDPWGVWESQIRRRAKNEHRRLDWMRERMNEAGDSVHNSLGNVVDNGVIFKTHDFECIARFENYINLSIKDGKTLSLSQALENILGMQKKGVPMYTGSWLGTPSHENGKWNVTTEVKNGHAYELDGLSIAKVELDGVEQNIPLGLYGINSWGRRFGDDGYWNADLVDIEKMFGPYVFTGFSVEKLRPIPS